MSIWNELRRRSVFKVGAAYALCAWIIAQVAVLINEPLGLPDRFDTAVLIILAIGFPLAILFSWVFELTPSGLRRTDDAPAEEGIAAAAGNTFNYVLAGLMAGALVGSGAIWFFDSDADDGWSLDAALAEIQASRQAGETLKAFELARDVERREPGTPALSEIWPLISARVSVPSEPPGAQVSWRRYESPTDTWQLAGTTPIADVRLPQGYLRLRFELEGYRPVDRTFLVPPGVAIGDAVIDASLDFRPPPARNPIRLDTLASLPEDMIRVPGWEATIEGKRVQLADFFLGRFEVTNREYKAFVDAGGYSTERYWQHPFVRDGEELPWREAMSLFTDRSGRPGPSTWLGGDYPEGEGNFPVSGVSWFEAAAYAVFAGRELPSVYHWRRAINGWNSGWLLPASNLRAESARPVGEAAGMSWVGAYDMGGNVREWVFNALGDERFVLGGAWNENLFSGLILNTTDDPYDRSETNGFRLAVTQDNSEIMSQARQAVSVPPTRDLLSFEPVSDDALERYARQYDYDKTPLNPVTEDSREERNWIRERVVVDAAYGDEKLPVYLYLPKNSRPPYQTIVLFPGANMFFQSSVDQGGFPLDFVVSNGRAVMLPVYKGAFDRIDAMGPEPGFDTKAGRDRWIEMHQDMRRAIDYLETRSDIDMDSLAYIGFSWGSQIAPNNLALDPRLKVAVLGLAGVLLTNRFLPEIDPMNFVGRVKVPVLMLSATYDNIFPLETSAIPFFDALGTPAADKKQVIYEAGHSIPPEILVGNTLEWLDRYLGPVE